MENKEITDEKIVEAAKWWYKHKTKVWVAIVAVVTLLGGNVDRLDKIALFFSSSYSEDVQTLKDSVSDLDVRVQKVEDFLKDVVK